MTDGSDLLCQTVKTLLGTNKGEWFLNEDEGLNYEYILTKKPDFDVIRNEITEGLKQVDETFVIEEYNYKFDKNKRSLTIDFVARNEKGEEVRGNHTF